MSAQNDYVSMLEMFINKLYPDHNFGFFGFTSFQAEQRVEEDMKYLGYNTEMVNRACVDTMNSFKSTTNALLYRLKCFVNDMLSKPHKDYQEKYPLEYRFVLTLILGYLNKLTDAAIIIVDDVEPYFKAKIKDVPVKDFTRAINQTRCYVNASNDMKLAEGMRRFEAWVKELGNKTIPPKELTIAEIEKQLGYKIKIVGEDK